MQIFNVPHATAQPTNATALPTTTQTGHLGIDDAEHGHVHTPPDSLSQMGSSPSSQTLDGSPLSLFPAWDPLYAPRETLMKQWVNNTLAATTATPAVDPFAGTEPPPWIGPTPLPKVRRKASPQRITATSPPPAKKQKVKTVPKLKTVPKPKTVPKLKAVPKPKAKAKAGKPKAKAKTVKPKAKPKTDKPTAKAKTVLKGTTKQGLKHTTTTTNRSPMPSQPPARKFKPIHFGPCTIYHGGKQRKYRLKESYASRRTTSFNDWAKMMTHIQTL